MNEKSKTFEMETKTGEVFNTGFVRIKGPGPLYADNSQLIWLTDLNTYQGLPHRSKEECRAKKQEKKRIMDEEYFD
jgi:hypothetical protein